MMRKSKAVACLLLGSAAMVLAACEKSPEESKAIYPDLDSCLARATPGEGEALCRKAWQDAQGDWNQNAPRYATRGACEQQHGMDSCQAAAGGAAFMPLLTGFLLTRALSGGFGFSSQPVYRDKSGYAYAGKTRLDVPPARDKEDEKTVYTSSGSSYGGRTRWDAAPATHQVASSTVSRGGFGSTGLHYSSSSGG